MSNEIINNNTNTTSTTNNAQATTGNNITIINLKHENNLSIVNTLRTQFGNGIDNLNIFPYQNGVKMVQFKFHKDNKRMFVEYPAFMATITPDYATLFLKKDGEPFPSVAYRVHKRSVAEKVTANATLNEYINTKVTDIPTFLESELTNESKVVMENLEISVLLRILEKEKTENTKLTYNRVFDLIRSKINESKDCGYLEKLCKTCVMLNVTFADKSLVNFNSIELFPKEQKVVAKVVKEPKMPTVKEPKAPKATTTAKPKKAVAKVTKEKLDTAITKAKEDKAVKEETKKIIEEAKTIKEFTNPTEVPTLENIETEVKPQAITINENMVDSIIDSI